MLEKMASLNSAVSGLVWGWPGMGLLLFAGVYMTVLTGGFQLRRFGYILRHTIGQALAGGKAAESAGSISQFQGMCTALAGTIGTGNIVGVAAAMASGGPGAVFWMWVMAVLGMATSFAENTLGTYYRRKSPAGEWRGGAMYCLEYGLGGRLGRALAAIFAFACLLASFGMGCMSQTNSIAGSMEAAFGIPAAATGAALAVLTFGIMRGGFKSAARASERLVPFMALFYIAGTLLIIALRFGRVPAAFAAIFRGAFGLRAAGGGIVGGGMARAVSWGFRRGAFSNEAGLGSAVMANSAAEAQEPVQQGMWGVFEVFVDTIVVCTLTALVLLTTGVIDPESGRAAASPDALAGEAFSTVFGSLGPKFIAVSILLFAYSSALGWSGYGTMAAEYLFGAKAAGLYKYISPCMVMAGAVMELELAWGLSDTFNGLMMLPNLTAVLFLAGTVVDITRNYKARHMHGADIKPMLSAYEARG